MKLFFVIFVTIIANEQNLFAAEAGMPQLDPKYWASQAFWLILVFAALYISVSKFFIPKIKTNLDDRENKIKEDLEEAKNLRDQSEIKIDEYNKIIENAKKDILKILVDSKKILNKEIQSKKIIIEKELDDELDKAHKEILEFNNNSADSITQISEEITSKIIYNLSGDELNKSSIKAAVSETYKENIGKYL